MENLIVVCIQQQKKQQQQHHGIATVGYHHHNQVFFCFCCYHLHAPNFKRILHFLGLVKKIPWSFHNKHLFFVESSLLCWIELNGNELNESYICRSNESHLWSFCFLFFLRCYEWEWMNGAMWQCRALVFSFSKKPKYKLLINDDADAVVDLHTRKKVTAIIDICIQYAHRNKQTNLSKSRLNLMQ